jgi:hypothetical protein
VFIHGAVPPIHRPQRRQIRGLHAELFTQMPPQGRRHDAHRIEQPSAHAQKADLQRQPQLQRRPPPLLDHLPFSQREGEKRLDLESAQITR